MGTGSTMISEQPTDIMSLNAPKARDGGICNILRLQDEEKMVILNGLEGEGVGLGGNMQLQKQQIVQSLQSAIIHSTTIGFTENLLLLPSTPPSDSNSSSPPENPVEIPDHADEYDDYKDTNFRDAFAAIMSDPDCYGFSKSIHDPQNIYPDQGVLDSELSRYRLIERLVIPTPDPAPEPLPNPSHTQPSVYTQLAQVYSSSVGSCTIFYEVIDPESSYRYELRHFPPNPHPSVSWDQRFINFHYRLRQRGIIVYNQYPIPIFCLTPEGNHGAIPATVRDRTKLTGFWARNSMPGGHQRRIIGFVSGKLRERNWWSWIVKSTGEYIYELPVGMTPRRYDNLEEAAERISEWRPGMKGWKKYHKKMSAPAQKSQKN